MRESFMPGVDEALLESFKKAGNCNAVVTGPTLKAKADDFAKNLGHDEWK